ncbi:MAG TPA: AAA family ATPase [Vicinamibacterales bacterium]|nr:AAA family ATPase [Vicinamibacterales bacterium]
MAGLDELDRGVVDASVAAPTRSPRPLVSVPPTVVRPPAPAVDLIVAPFALRSAADAPIVMLPGARRPLLDLFPPVQAVGAALPVERMPPPLARGTATAPKLARRPLERDAAEISPRQPRADETFYGFAEPPFDLEPDLRFLYHSTEHDRAAQQIAEAIARRDGLILVTGPTGIGKTLLCKAIADQLDQRTLISIAARPAASFDDLVRMLLADFGVLSREELAATRADAAAHELAGTLRSFLASLSSLEANAVIVLDEAQNVAPAVLGALHALAAELPRTLQIVLAGQPALTSILAQPELRAVDEHVALRLQLGPLAADEVPGYLMHRVHVAAASPHIEFDDAALDQLYEVSRGVPRIVNQICDRAISLAYDDAATKLDAKTVAAAAADLGIESPGGRREALRGIALAVAIAMCVCAGASASTWLFRDRVHQILVHYGYRSPG